MDPVTTTLVAAFVVGASSAARGVGEQAIQDAYGALKELLSDSYSGAKSLAAALVGLEAKPESDARRAVLAEELEEVGALDDPALAEAAESVLAAAESDPAAAQVAIDWEDVSAARLKVGRIRAQGGTLSFRVARLQVRDSIEIDEITAGDTSGK